MATKTYEFEREAVEQIKGAQQRINAELSKVIIGQEDVIEHLFIAILSGGHCLLTGAPGLAKTLLVKSLTQLFDLKFQRIQFTPDLMPADITGTEILQQTDGERKMTTSDWLLYNILELKFIRGLKVQDVARRLAMSESDLYRKQLLIEELEHIG